MPRRGPSSIGENILSKALDRSLDGEFDRMAAITLGLLEYPSTRSVGRQMIHAIFNPNRKTNSETRIEIPFPNSTLALVAEDKFPVQLSHVLWDSVPTARRLEFIRQVTCFGLMNGSVDWSRAGCEAMKTRGERGEKRFGREALAWASLSIFKELYDMYRNDTESVNSHRDIWADVFPWMVERAIAGDLHKINDQENLGLIEWAAHSSPENSIKIDVAGAAGLIGIDPEAFPCLAKIGVGVRREYLYNIARKPSESTVATPLI